MKLGSWGGQEIEMMRGHDTGLSLSRWGIEHLGVSFGSNFLLFSNKSSQEPHS